MQNMEEIYKEYFEIVNKYLFCLTNNADIAEELTQETFYRAIKNIYKFRNECKLSVWLCQIAKNLWYDELKKNKKIKPIDNEEFVNFINDADIENNVISNLKKIELYKKIQKLDIHTKEVIYLRITGELSFKEIASILNKTESWARVTFYRGKQKLKEDD